jgi:hypothetical protein
MAVRLYQLTHYHNGEVRALLRDDFVPLIRQTIYQLSACLETYLEIPISAIFVNLCRLNVR